MTTEDAKSYLSSREIPQLFESLMTGLMFYRPEDHIQYLQECLKKIREDGVEKVRWNLFIESRRKTPLPPITPDGRPRTPGGKEKSFITDSQSIVSEVMDQTLSRTNSAISDHRDDQTTVLVDDVFEPWQSNTTVDQVYQNGAHQVYENRERVAKKSERDESKAKQSKAKVKVTPQAKRDSLGSKGQRGKKKEPVSPRAPEKKKMESEDRERKGSNRKKQQASVDLDEREKPVDREEEKKTRIKADRQDSVNYNERRQSQNGGKQDDDIKNLPDPDTGRPQSARSLPYRSPTPLASRSSTPRSRPNSAPLRDVLSAEHSMTSMVDLSTESKITEEVPKSLEEHRGSPLPPIRQGAIEGGTVVGSIKLPNCPIILAMGGPGSGKATQCEMLVERYSGWVHLSMGDLLRKQIMEKGSVDEKWGVVSSLVSKGDLAPDEMTADLIKTNISQHMDAKGLIIEGYPRTSEQLQEYTALVGRVDLAFVLDCEEKYLMQRLLSRGQLEGRIDDSMSAVTQRIMFFKDKTLPVIKAMDDQGKLAVLDGDRDSNEIFFDLATVVDSVFAGGSAGGSGGSGPSAPSQPGGAPVPRPPSSPRPAQNGSRPTSTRLVRSRAGSRPNSGFTRVPTLLDVKVSDTGRKEGMPKCPIILCISGPGCKRTKMCERLAAERNGVAHVAVGDLLRAAVLKNQGDSMWDKVRSAMNDGKMVEIDTVAEVVDAAIKNNADAKALILDGYPRNAEELENFNSTVGGLSYTILFDSDESMMRMNLAATADTREDSTPAAIDSRISDYKHNTLPVLGHLDDAGKLAVVDADQPEEEVLKQALHALSAHVKDEGRSMMANRPPSARVDPPDTGRKPGMIQCPFFAIVGAPGTGVEGYVTKVAAKYPKYGCVQMGGKSIEELKTEMIMHLTAEGLIIQNFPMDQRATYEFNKSVGGLDAVIVLDVSEEVSRRSASNEEVDAYKRHTLPLLGYYDDRCRLDVISLADLRTDEDIVTAISDAIDSAKSKGRITQDDMEAPTVSSLLSTPDTGRKSGLPECPIIAVVGAPGSGYEQACQQLVEKVPGAVLVEAAGLDGSGLAGKMSADAKAVFLQGFPQNSQQADQFNENVGGMSGVLVIDATEDYCKQNGGDPTAISCFKNDIIPVLGYYDDFRRLEVIQSDRSVDDLLPDAQKVLDEILNKQVG